MQVRPILNRKASAMTKITRRNLARAGIAQIGALGLTGTLAAPALAQSGKMRWRMVTSWPRRLPGPGMSAERVAERIGTLSGGRLEISVAAAGEVVPALEVLDAVGSDVAEIGHTASFYWQGKEPAAAFFTTVPFGLLPNAHVAWVDAGGGQALWDELCAPFRRPPHPAKSSSRCNPADRRRRIRRARFRHRARALPLCAVLLLSRFQQAERHRRVHRLAQSLAGARPRAAGDRGACLRHGSVLRARRDGAAQCRSARGADHAG